jgi:hypothetical protein
MGCARNVRNALERGATNAGETRGGMPGKNQPGRITRGAAWASRSAAGEGANVNAFASAVRICRLHNQNHALQVANGTQTVVKTLFIAIKAVS